MTTFFKSNPDTDGINGTQLIIPSSIMTKNWNISVHFTNIDSLLTVDCLILTENHKYRYNEKEQTHMSSKNNIRHLSTFKNISTLNEIQ